MWRKEKAVAADPKPAAHRVAALAQRKTPCRSSMWRRCGFFRGGRRGWAERPLSLEFRSAIIWLFPAMTSRSRTAGGTSALACKAVMQEPQGTRWRAVHHAFSVQWKMETHHPDDSLIPRLSTNTQSPNSYRLGFFLPAPPVKTPLASRASRPGRRVFRPNSLKFLSLLSVGTRALATPLLVFSMTYRQQVR